MRIRQPTESTYGAGGGVSRQALRDKSAGLQKGYLQVNFKFRTAKCCAVKDHSYDCPVLVLERDTENQHRTDCLRHAAVEHPYLTPFWNHSPPPQAWPPNRPLPWLQARHPMDRNLTEA